MGKIFVGGMKRGHGYPKLIDKRTKVYPIHSRGKGTAKRLSPFLLGPIKAGSLEAANFENFWQFSKVYNSIVTLTVKRKKLLMWEQKAEAHCVNGVVQGAFYKWRDRGFACKFAIRRPNKKLRPLFSLHPETGQRMEFAEAKDKIYNCYYKKLARECDVYKEILTAAKTSDIMLIEPDGPCPIQYPNGIEVSKEYLETLLANEPNHFWHGCACAQALLEDLTKH